MRQYECLVIQKAYLAKTSKHSLPCFHDSLKFQQEIAHLFVGEVLDHTVLIYIYMYRHRWWFEACFHFNHWVKIQDRPLRSL